MSKAFFPTNDGHIGNIQKLSLTQLLELIQRQEKLLKKRSFLNTLADKGEKVKQHLQVLNEELQRRKQGSDRNTVEGSHETQRLESNIEVTNAAGESVTDTSERVDVKPMSSIKKQNLAHEQGDVVKGAITDSATGSLEKDFENLQVQDRTSGDSVRTKHQYEIALERAEQHSKEPQKGHQRLNRNINIAHVEELPAELRTYNPSPYRNVQKKTAMKNLPVEESAAVPPSYRYDEVKVIPLNESLSLQIMQKQKQEELQAQMTAEKLVQRLNIKMETYNPEGIDMSYRNTKPGLDHDSDDDDDDPDEGAMADIITSDTED